MTLPIHDQGGLLESEITLEIERGDTAVRLEVGGRLGAMELRMGLMESKLTAVEGKADQAIALGNQAVALGDENVALNKEILLRFDKLEGVVSEVSKETADGVKVVERVSRWGQTARDFHVDSVVKAAWRLVWPVALFWAAVRILGPEAASRIMGWAAHK